MPTTVSAKRLLIPVVFAPLLMAAYLSTCGPMTLPECPHEWDFQAIRIYNDRTKDLEPLQTLNGSPHLSAPQAQTNVPEFNDCQRLVIGSGATARYDSLYAVFAHDSLGDSLVMKPINMGLAFPMVEILSLGGTYSKLALEPGVSCLFVFQHGNQWYARMVAFGSVEGDCHSPRPVSALASYPELSIRRTSPGLDWTDYPAVARWEWDVKFNVQVIGFRCLDAWCEVGEAGHYPETGPDLTGTMGGIAGLSGSPVLKVKGWYDEQRLSPAKSGWWKPGKGPLSVVGTVVPIPGLDQLDYKSFFQTWQLIAYVNLSAPSSDYHNQQGFAPMASAASVTTISFCMEDWGGPNPLSTGGCDGISIQDRKAAKCGTEPTAPTMHWWAKTIPAGSTAPRYWCIVRRSAPTGVPVPGTARWRWLADDETTWGRCGGACCAGH